MMRHAASGRRATTSASFPIPDCANTVARAHGITERLRVSAARIETGRALPSDIIAALHEAETPDDKNAVWARFNASVVEVG